MNREAISESPRPIEFAVENALPSAQYQAPVLYQQRLGASDNGGLQMRIAVAVVVVILVAARGQLLQEGGEILLQCRIVVFLNQNGGRGMRPEHVAYASRHPALRYHFLNNFRDVPELNSRMGFNLHGAGARLQFLR